MADVQDVTVRVKVDIDLTPLRELRDLLDQILASADSAQRPQDALDRWMTKTMIRSGDPLEDVVTALTGHKVTLGATLPKNG